jgi:hypothetical protein
VIIVQTSEGAPPSDGWLDAGALVKQILDFLDVDAQAIVT